MHYCERPYFLLYHTAKLNLQLMLNQVSKLWPLYTMTSVMSPYSYPIPNCEELLHNLSHCSGSANHFHQILYKQEVWLWNKSEFNTLTFSELCVHHIHPAVRIYTSIQYLILVCINTFLLCL